MIEQTKGMLMLVGYKFNQFTTEGGDPHWHCNAPDHETLGTFPTLELAIDACIQHFTSRLTKKKF